MASYLEVADPEFPRRLAFEFVDGDTPIVMFLPGFASNMYGTKATTLAAHCLKKGQAFLRFDYSGHGLSDGQFEEGTIGLWLADALAVFDALVRKPALLVGSSMGGWMMLHLAAKRQDQVAGLVGLASAPDFIDRWVSSLTHQERHSLRKQGHLAIPSDYGGQLKLTTKLIDEAGQHNLLDKTLDLSCFCHLIHGQMDLDVDWTISANLASKLISGHTTLELIHDGDHRLSRDSDLNRMTSAVNRVSLRINGDVHDTT